MAGISITLAGNFGKLDELKDKAGKTAASIKSAFGSNLGKAAFASLATGATAAFAAIVAGTKAAIEAGGELSDMVARTGASGKGLLILEKAFENAGIAGSKLPDVLNRMQKALAGVNEDGEPTNAAFSKLGLSIDELIAMDPAEALAKIGKAIGSIEDPAQRTARVMELFGKSGGELLVVFTDTSAFETAKIQLGGLADLLPGMANDADYVADAFGSLDVKAKQLGAGVAKELMPQLLNFSRWLNETDFSETGQRVGALTNNILKLGGAVGNLIKITPAYQAGKFVEGALNDFGNLTPADKLKAQKEAADQAAGDPEYMKSRTGVAAERKASVAAVKSATDEKRASSDTERTAKAAEAKAQAERKSAEEKNRSRAAAKEEYNLESRMLSARLRGDADTIARLEREKSIRAEVAKLVQAGFTPAEAARPAAAKVDAQIKIGDQDRSRNAADDAKSKTEEGKQQIRSILEGKLGDVKGKIDDQQYQSSVAKVGSMQRVGGGGGAVSSGLDYARQSTSLQQEANQILRQISQLLHPAPDD